MTYGKDKAVLAFS